MQTEAQVSLDCQAVPHPENNVIKDGDPGALPSSPNHVAPKPGMFLGLIISIYCWVAITLMPLVILGTSSILMLFE